MSNLPKIFATCKAGCKWEVPHKSDFDKLIPFETCNPNGGLYELELGKEYRVYLTKNSEGNGYATTITANVQLQMDVVTTDVPIGDFDEYKEYVTIKLLGIRVTEFTTAIYYDIDGERKNVNVDPSNNSIESVFLLAGNTDKVLLVKSELSEVTFNTEDDETDVGAWDIINTSSSPSTTDYTLTMDTIFVVKGISSSLNINLNGHKCLLSMTDVLAGEITFTSRSSSGVTIINQNLCDVSTIDDCFDTINAKSIILIAEGKLVKGDTILVESNDKGIWNVNRAFYGEI